jgi:hypothetical protein
VASISFHIRLARLGEVRERLVTACEAAGGYEILTNLTERRYALDWAVRIARAALVIVEERTPEGSSDTLLDALARAVAS